MIRRLNLIPCSIRAKYILFFCVFLWVSNSTLTGQGLVMKQSGPELTEWPDPSGFVHDIPVYEKFDQLEPIFHFYNDTTYIINFWATWCKPCVEELPVFEALYEQSKDKKIKVILISLDFPRQIESKLVPFLKKHKLQLPVLVLLDGKFNNWIDKVAPEWSGSIPATLIYRADKRVFSEKTFADKQELETIINSL